jgi:V/A-type H+/Na+-transporting ATPase subunit A
MTTGTIQGVTGNLVTIKVDGPVGQNEVGFVITRSGERLMAEVIKITNDMAYAQVYESTRGLRFGDKADFTGQLLEVSLGPGILSRIYDGLQNNLEKKTGVFLKRGEYTAALEESQAWDFEPLAKTGANVQPGDWLGTVKEGWLDHRIMVPFAMEGRWQVVKISPAGRYRTDAAIAELQNDHGESKSVSMTQRWPIKRPITAFREKPRPFRLLETGVRIFDTFNPIAEGGTGFIPGPFGCGKTVLQQALSKNAAADVIIFAACGERANEVVELITEFPRLSDPRTGRKLMERTVIICNTSNMPVAAREASVYTAMTLAEYYRAMGHRVLLLADSTSRWAQALREMSNRLEELPGPDAFPMDLGAVISAFYARAGIVYLNNGQKGSVTFIGTVSPSGGNLKEPVTENTKKAARCFFALQQARADRKRYPAVDPVESYSKYLEYPEIEQWFAENMGGEWVGSVKELKNIVVLSREANDQISILGDDSVPMDYHTTFWRGELVDFALMQQDAFDQVDAYCSMERQAFMVGLIRSICHADFEFKTYDEIAPWYKRMINCIKQMNYAVYDSVQFHKFQEELEQILAERRKA